MWGEDLLAEIYRPAGMNMTQPGFEKHLSEVLEATQQAGRELIESGKVFPETMARIKKPLDKEETIAEIANLFWKSCISEGMNPRTWEQNGKVPRPESLDSFMSIMSMGLNTPAAQDTQTVLQFTFSGSIEGACYFTINKGNIETTAGTADKFDLKIDAPFELWMDVISGKADGTQMFMEGKYLVEGNISLLRMFRGFSDYDTESHEDEKKVPEKIEKQRLTCHDIISGMPQAFNAEAAGDLEACIYYKVTGEEPGDYHLKIANKVCTFNEGVPSSPTLTIETPSEVWVSISVGELNAQKAFILQKYRATGNLSLLMKLNSLFTTHQPQKKNFLERLMRARREQGNVP